MKTPPTLLSRNCVLSFIGEEDWEILHEIMKDDGVKQFLPDFYNIIKLKEDFLCVMNSFAVLCDKDESIIWGIYLKGSLIGFIGLLDIPQNTTIFYSVDKKFRCKGLAKESVSAVIDYIKKMNLSDKIYSEVFEDNAASIAVLKNNGFIPTHRIENKIAFLRRIK